MLNRLRVNRVNAVVTIRVHRLFHCHRSSPSVPISKETKQQYTRNKSIIHKKKDLLIMAQLVKFGVVTDIHYADHDDAPAGYDPTKTRYYRNSLNQIDAAFNHWNRDDTLEVMRTQFVLQLGDIIDGINNKLSNSGNVKALRRTLDQFERNNHIPTFHTVGNHELYNFGRSDLMHIFKETLLNHMKINGDSIGLHNLKLLQENLDTDYEMPLYYKFTLQNGIKFIALDCFDISVIGYDNDHPNYKKAEEILNEYNGHRDTWDLDGHLMGSNKRFQECNGAISDKQLKWLDEELEESDNNNESVIIFGHVGLHSDSCNWGSILWNYDEVIDCFNRHSCVVAYLCGHSHSEGYGYGNGVHYVVFNAIIETSPLCESFATITLFEDRLEIEGNGIEKSRVLPLYLKKSFINIVDDEEKNSIVVDDGSQDCCTVNPTVKVEV